MKLNDSINSYCGAPARPFPLTPCRDCKRTQEFCTNLFDWKIDPHGSESSGAMSATGKLPRHPIDCAGPE